MGLQHAITALISDVDATLVTANKVLTGPAVADLHARGIAVVVMAGFNGGAYVRPDLTRDRERAAARRHAHVHP